MTYSFLTTSSVMDAKTLKSFIAVATHHSFTTASEQLHLTQPAISKRIAALEKSLECRLFDRVGHNIQLTAEGQLLLKEAQQLVQQMEFTRQKVRNLSGAIAGPLQVATGHHIGLHRLPKIIKALLAQHSGIDLNIQFMDSEEAWQGVLEGNIELAVLTLPEDNQPSFNHPQLQHYPIWNDQLGLFCAHDYELASHTNKGLQVLSDYPVIFPDKFTFTRTSIIRYFNEHDIPLPQIKTGNYLETIKTLVECGLGWGVLPKTLENNQLVQLFEDEFKLHRTLGLIHHKKRPMSNAAKAFLDLLLTDADATG
ncbi:LysR family transcriptional regulator [Pleionea sp. CnH1-48]|uniref:LysR family transcriptional regulator n=1 Tax=Pleionea sp. CnH1-48 TaxID=2954494 RepID=UPI0020981B5D|nr:LysR family transcriptional regulator [Pleionea sp. CnH1-48]MCO7223627.1 LysR family transcriptional regulator [Pleionea sp. CnH1-48]